MSETQHRHALENLQRRLRRLEEDIEKLKQLANTTREENRELGSKIKSLETKENTVPALDNKIPGKYGNSSSLQNTSRKRNRDKKSDEYEDCDNPSITARTTIHSITRMEVMPMNMDEDSNDNIPAPKTLRSRCLPAIIMGGQRLE